MSEPVQREKKPGRKPGRASIDWVPIKAAYLSDPTKSLDDIAKEFGLYITTVRKRSVADGGWPALREAETAKLEAALEKKRIEERLLSADDFNLDDVKVARALRSHVIREMKKLDAAGKLDADRLQKLTAAAEKASTLGRRALGLSTNNNELTGKGGAPLNLAPPVIHVEFTSPGEGEDGAEEA